MDRWHHQRGMTAIGWMLVLGLMGFITLITLKMVPLYMEYGKVASTFESLQNEPGITGKTRAEIIKLISKRFDINDVRNVDASKTKVSKDKGVLRVGIKYERREHLMGNVEVVVTFDKQIEVPAH